MIINIITSIIRGIGHLIFALLIAGSLVSPVYATAKPYYWCGSVSKLETCTPEQGGIPMRFASNVVHYMILEDTPYRSAIRAAIDAKNDELDNITYVFDGYGDPGLSYEGIIIVSDKKGRIIGSQFAYGITRYETIVNHGDYLEIKLSISYMTKALYKDFIKSKKPTKKNKAAAKEAYIQVALHEAAGHGVGLGHNTDPNSAMGGSYSPGRVFLEEDIAAIEGIYENNVETREVQLY